MNSRDYDAIARRIRAGIGALEARRAEPETTGKPAGSVDSGVGAGGVAGDAALRVVVDALWDGLRESGVSWVGFYRFHPGAPADRAMTLGPSRDTPACSPIGLHGVCGQALIRRETRIVRDVAELGGGYVACDPRDRSEIVAPCYSGAPGERVCCWGVLDLDSHEVGAFDGSDERGLARVLEAAGLGVR